MSPLVPVAACYFFLQQIQGLSIIDRALYGEWEGKGGDKVTQALNLLFLASSLALLFLGRRDLAKVRSRATHWVLILGFLLCSAAWSIEPSISVRQTVLFAFLVMGSVGLATTISADRFMSIVATMCAVSAVISLGLQVLYPSLTQGYDLDFRGIFSHKNVLGQAMAVGTLAGLHCLRSGHGSRLWGCGRQIIMALTAVRSGSATACLTIATFYGLDLFAWSYSRKGAMRLFALATLAVAFPALIGAVVAPDALLELIGKDPTLTGRTEIWEFVTQKIWERPILGWGYLAFFNTSNPAAIELGDIVHWFVPQAHNTLLEILLHLGVVGAMIYALLILQTVRVAIRCLRSGCRAIGMSTLLCCVAIIEVGVSEMVLLAPVQGLTAMFVVLSLMSERALYEARYQRSARARAEWLPPVRAARA